uniref:protein TASOR 2 n=1 Tax=Euleptes europaea TaxID=460621 RepID=UPI002541BE50|nr:protein TASOR 2 [Euleptes europaea]
MGRDTDRGFPGARQVFSESGQGHMELLSKYGSLLAVGDLTGRADKNNIASAAADKPVTCMNFLPVESVSIFGCLPLCNSHLSRQPVKPKRMSPLNRKNLAGCKKAALYCAWKGQLFIQDQRVCDLALRSPFSGTIPAQLPAKLETRYVVAVSDLRKKLPEVAFGKNNYANDEVHSQGILFSLYEVEILNPNELRVDQLIESLKEKDLALVRYLNEHGLFVLLNSSALAKGKDSIPEEIPRLQALFVISSPKATCLAAKDLRCNHRANKRSSQVSLLLPALRFALAEAAKDHNEEGVPLGALVQQHVQELATLDKNLLPTFTDPDRMSLSFDQYLKKSDLEAVSGKCSQKSFSRLHLYLSDPQNYTLEMSAASACPGTDSRSSNGSRVCDASGVSGLSSDSLLPEGAVPLGETTRSGKSAESTPHSTEGAGKPSRASERTLQRCKRRSSRLLGASTRKKWAPLKVLCIMESNKKRKKSKKKKLDLSPVSSKDAGPSVDSGEPTLKLKNLQYPLRRKRGAEVLSAEFVQRTRHEPPSKATPSSEGPDAEQKKARFLNCRKSTEVGKVEKVNKCRAVKKKDVHHDADEAESEILGDENSPSSERSALWDTCPPLRRDECDSHALNMLADLALSSCNSLLLSNTNRSGLSHNLSRERRHLHRGKLLCKASDHEYHRINAKLKGSSLSGGGPQGSPPAPVQPSQSAESPSSPRERGRTVSGKKKSARPHPAKPLAELPAEIVYFSDPNVPSLISIEHSYASLTLEPLRKQLPWRGSPSPPNSKNGVKSAKSGPLVGKVLPFRHQQNICHPHKQLRTYLPFSRSAVMAARPKEDFGKSHQVTFCDQSVRVTCQWEDEYLFSLDSKYTNNSLEKTVIRAVHGPWDVSLSDDVEEMKMILHMWVALFYSKPFRSPRVRKVVEHSNPAKYVSLNSVVDPLELVDDGEGFYDSETRSADLFSEAYQAPSKVEGRAYSPMEKPLSCNELSSTNCIEYEAPLADPVETNYLPLEGGAVSSLASDLGGLPQAFDKVSREEPEEEFFLGPLISVCSQSGGSLNGSGCLEAEANHTVILFEVSQSDSAASMLPELPETTADTQGVGSPRSAVSAEKPEIDSSLSSAEKDSCQIDSSESLHTSGVTWLEANTEYEKDDCLCKGEGDTQDLPMDEVEEDVDGESVELESIDLALSDSNDADVEVRDVDLDQDNEELPPEVCAAEEACVCDATSPGDSLTTLIPSPTASSLQQTVPETNHPAHQTIPERDSESPEDQEDSAASDPNFAFPEQVGLDEGPCTDEEEEDVNGADTVPLDTSHQVIQEEQKTRQMPELLNDTVEDEEIQCLGLNDSEFRVSSKATEPSEKNENNGNIFVSEEIAHDDKLNQVAATVTEEIKPFCEPIDTVSGLKVEGEGSCSKEDSGLNWIRSMALECVTPPESDEESWTTDQLTTSDPGLVVDGHLERQGIFVNQESESKEDSQCLSTSHEGRSSHRVDGVEEDPFGENEAAPIAEDVLSSPCCKDRAKSGTPSLDGKFQLAGTAVPSKSNDYSIVPVLCGEVGLEPASQEASILAREGGLFKKGHVEVLPCVPGECLVDSIAPMLFGEVGLGPASQEASILAREGGLYKEGRVEILPCVQGGRLVEYPPEEPDSLFHGGTSEGQKQEDPGDAVDVQLASKRAQSPTSVLGPNTNWEVESVSADDGEELFGDPYCKDPSANACRTRSTDSTGVTGATYICDLRPEQEISKSDDWVYLGEKTRILDAEPEDERFDWPLMCRRNDRPALPALKLDGEQGPLKGYINFSVTKKHKEKTRTFYSSKRGDGFMKESGLINSLSRTWRVLDDPVQSTLDMECLRFHYKLKQILGKSRPQFSTSSDPLIAPQVTAETLPLRKVPEAPVLNLPPRSRSPLLITIMNPGARRSATHWYPRVSMPGDPFDPPTLPRDSFSKAARPKSQGQGRPAPFHLNKLTYNNKLKDCRGDISVIMDEFAELSRVMKLDDQQMSNKGRDPNTTSEDVPEKKCPSLPGRMASYEHLFDDLCNTLHFRLKNVAKEACKKPYSFYLVETDDDPFFGRIKNLLKKGGHSEAEPQHFCKASHPEMDRLVVIIRNEDIFLHVHKIPSLLRLKRFPNVTFAGVDSPEDILDHTYQELFHSGGFVVSDDQVLETMTTGELKEVIKTLEQLNGHWKWRWLLHYKETKKLRENARVDSAAHSKDAILRSCQGANFTEVLHYHRCDSRSSTRPEYLNCLLNLQVQHISARLAVFLTEKPGTSREALESKGILVLDVNTFVATAQDLATSYRSNYW